LETILWSDDTTNSVIALKDNAQSTRSRANPTRLSSVNGKETDITKKITMYIIYYVYSTMKIEDTEELG